MAPDGDENQHYYTEELQECILKAAEEIKIKIDEVACIHIDIGKMEGVVQKTECYKMYRRNTRNGKE